MTIQLWAQATFEASHCLPQSIGGTPEIHGHSYWVKCYAETSSAAPIPMPAWKDAVQTVVRQLDHKHLNSLLESPTMEGIAEWIAQQIPNAVKVEVWRESIGCGVTWKRGNGSV